MDFITKLISDLVADGTIADTGLLFLIIAGLIWTYKNVIKPLKDRVDQIPTYDEVKGYADGLDDGHIESIEDVSKKINDIEKKLAEVEEYLKIEVRDHEQLKRDLDQIKTILNQFQGHMMYNNHGGPGHGNRELR